MPLNFFGKVLFPRKSSWRRQQQTKFILAAILVAVIFAGIVSAMMFYANSKK